jgi:hypothetical protein
MPERPRRAAREGDLIARDPLRKYDADEGGAAAEAGAEIDPTLGGPCTDDDTDPRRRRRWLRI